MLSKRTVVVLIGLLIAAVCLAACQGSQTVIPATPTATRIPPTQTPTTTPTPLPAATPTPTETPTPTPTPTPSPLELLQAANDASAQASSFRFEMDICELISGEGLQEDVEITFLFGGAIQMPDRTQGTMEVSMAGNEATMELISIGETTYFTDPETGAWQVQDQSAMPFKPEDMLIDLADLNNLKLVELTEIDGVPAYHISGNTLMPLALGAPLGKVEVTMMVDYWISQETNLPIQSEAKGQLNLKDEVAITLDVWVTMRFFDYNAPIEITPPPIP